MEDTVTLRGAKVGAAATAHSDLVLSSIVEAPNGDVVPLSSAKRVYGSGEFSQTQERERPSFVVDSMTAMVISNPGDCGQAFGGVISTVERRSN